jgi:hypothetical protein
MCDDGFAELANLKKRLESLGVKIKSGISDSGGFAVCSRALALDTIAARMALTIQARYGDTRLHHARS